MTDILLEKIKNIGYLETAFEISIRGNILINNLLDHLLRQSLPTEHFSDFQNLNIGPKVDLCVALGTLAHQNKNLFVLLNKYRNEYAHTEGYSISKKNVENLLDISRQIFLDYPEISYCLGLHSKEFSIEKGLASAVCTAGTVLFLCIRDIIKNKSFNEVMQDEIRQLADELTRVAPHLGKDNETDKDRITKSEKLFKEKWELLLKGTK